MPGPWPRKKRAPPCKKSTPGQKAGGFAPQFDKILLLWYIVIQSTVWEGFFVSMEQLHSGELYSPNDPEIMV